MRGKIMTYNPWKEKECHTKKLRKYMKLISLLEREHYRTKLKE
jgi:hypothetical protein